MWFNLPQILLSRHTSDQMIFFRQEPPTVVLSYLVRDRFHLLWIEFKLRRTVLRLEWGGADWKRTKKAFDEKVSDARRHFRIVPLLPTTSHRTFDLHIRFFSRSMNAWHWRSVGYRSACLSFRIPTQVFRMALRLEAPLHGLLHSCAALCRSSKVWLPDPVVRLSRSATNLSRSWRFIKNESEALQFCSDVIMLTSVSMLSCSRSRGVFASHEIVGCTDYFRWHFTFHTKKWGWLNRINIFNCDWPW